jgi:energy-coupling factor transporter ATP-binding protein EcfA2
VVALNAADDLISELEELARSVENLVFGGDPTGLAHARERDRIVRTLRSYVIPRMTVPSTPLLVVFAGPTGAGKSTLINSVSGLEITETGPLRPTTRVPVILAADGSGYERVGGIDCVVVEGRARILDSLTLVDTPDLDSTSREHRAAAEMMIDNADVVVFVSSARRYADLVPWEVLRRARSRGAPLIHVLNRLTSGATGALADYRRRLLQEGTDGDIVVVHEHHLAGSPSVPSVAVRSLRRRLMRQVTNSQRERAEIVRSVLWVTLGQARDLIAAAELGTTEVDLIQGLLTRALSPDLERIRAAGAAHVRVDFDVSRLAAARPQRARAWMRRKAPDPAAIAVSRRRVSEMLATAIATDIRSSTHDGLAAVPDQTGSPAGLDQAAQATLTTAIDSWWMLLEEMSRLGAGDRLDVRSLILAVSTLGSDPSLPVLEAALPGTDPAIAIDEATDALIWALKPVYASVRDHVMSSVNAEVTPVRDVDQARTVVAEVVARSAFADA